MDMSDTGTSVSGLATILQTSELDNREAPFPLKIYTSTMPRASETCRWDEYDFRLEELSNLNPLDKGDFAGKELLAVKNSHPEFYNRLKKDPFKTRCVHCNLILLSKKLRFIMLTFPTCAKGFRGESRTKI